jgi:tetratricopeptide (TPR) repeat protein
MAKKRARSKKKGGQRQQQQQQQRPQQQQAQPTQPPTQQAQPQAHQPQRHAAPDLASIGRIIDQSSQQFVASGARDASVFPLESLSTILAAHPASGRSPGSPSQSAGSSDAGGAAGPGGASVPPRAVETIRSFQQNQGEGAARFLAGVDNVDLATLCDIPGFNPLLLLVLRVQECFDRATAFFRQGLATNAVEWFSGSASDAVSARSVAAIHVVEYCSNLNAAVAHILAGNAAEARTRAERALTIMHWVDDARRKEKPMIGPELPPNLQKAEAERNPAGPTEDENAWYMQQVAVDWLREQSKARSLVVRGLSSCLEGDFEKGLVDFEAALVSDSDNAVLRAQIEQLDQLFSSFRQVSRAQPQDSASLHAHLLSTGLLPRFLESLLERIPDALVEKGRDQQRMLAEHQLGEDAAASGAAQKSLEPAKSAPATASAVETTAATDVATPQRKPPAVITGTSMSAAAAVAAVPKKSPATEVAAAPPDPPAEPLNAATTAKVKEAPARVVTITPPERKSPDDLFPLIPTGDVFDSDDEIHDLPQMAMVEAEDQAAAQTFEYARTSKERGNDCFERGDFETALLHYGEALKLHSTDAAATAVFLSNRSLCHLKLHNYADAIVDASVAIQLRPSIKPLARRATAYAELRQWSLAVADYKRALRFEPKNIECLRELKKCLIQVSAECSEQLDACKTHLAAQQNRFGSSRDIAEIKKLQVQISDVQAQLEEVRDDLATVATLGGS